MKKALFFPLQVSLYTFGYLYASGSIIQAQVVPDGTTSTTVNAENGNFTIEQGDRAGNNLFHSFGDFSVPTNGSAFFNNATDVSNIFSRVTGGNISNIDGLIGANGSANLFLINPSGILFGNNARLDIGGSFYGSTASSILFEDGEFSAVDNLEQPILTVNAPVGLGFRDNPGDIVNRSIGQSNEELGGGDFAAGETFALVGGNIILDGTVLNLDGGQISLGGLAEPGIVGLNENGSLNFPNNVALSDIILAENSTLNVNASNEGSIIVNARNLEISDASNLFVGILGGEESNTNEVGNIDILVESIDIQDSSGIQISTLGEGNTGDIVINAFDSIFLDGNSSILTSVGSEGRGDSGSIEVLAGSINIRDSSRIEVSTSGEGNTGDISIFAVDNIFLDGNSSILTSVGFEGVGNSGDILVSTDSLSLSNNSQISSSGFGVGDTGGILIQANESIFLDDSFIASDVLDGSIGNSGDIVIDTGILELLNGSTILALSSGRGNSGNIEINTAGDISFRGVDSDGFGSLIATATLERGQGNSGDIKISANNIFLTDGGQIFSGTFGEGNGGNISINTSNDIFIQGENVDFPFAGISTNVFSLASGNGGNISISSDNLSLSNGGLIDASTAGLGNGGDVEISTTGNLTLNSGGVINAGTNGEGNGGSIEVNASNDILIQGVNSGETDNSGLFANASQESEGNAGNILISAQDFRIANNGTVRVDALGNNNAGSIVLVGDNLILDNQASIIATGSGGNAFIGLTDILALNNNSSITVQEFGNNSFAGSIGISAKFLIAFPSEAPGNGNDIIANSFGFGGDIDIFGDETKVLGIQPRIAIEGNGSNDFDTTGSLNIEGEIVDTILDVTSISIPDLIKSEQTITQACQANRETIAINSLTIKGKGGIPNDPSLPLDSQNISINGETNSTSTIPQPIETSQGEIQPARGIKVTKDGGIVLTAYRTNNSGARLPHNSQNCS